MRDKTHIKMVKLWGNS